jgi:hypothetical protein
LRRVLLWIVAGLLLLYVTASACMYVAMRQPPERFGAIMSKVPLVAMILLPSKPIWMSARAGQLEPGDAAPDFALPTVDHTRTVTLSQEWPVRPVVLIFGSYT